MYRLCLILFALIFCGCSANILPQQVPGGVVDLKDNSQTISKSGLTIKVRVQDLQYAPYRQVDNITSFYLDVQNNQSTPWEFPFELVRLVARDGRQFTPISPLRVKEIVSRDLPYMVPYPYVGYYYLEDEQKGSYFNNFTSNLPYYASNNPQDIFTQALPEEAIEPGNRITGLLYFVCDLETMLGFDFKIKIPPQGDQGEGLFIFPFNIEK